MLKVLITGSSGFVGRHLVHELETSTNSKGNYQVTGFDLSQGQDVRDFEQIRNVVDQVQPDLIFHLAAQAFVPESTMNPRRGFDTNLIGTLNVLESVRQTGMHSRILVAGTSEEYGYDRDDLELNELSVAQPTTPYGVSKLSATTLSQTYSRIHGIDVVATRAWNHIGPGASPSYAVSAFGKRVAEAEKYGTPVTHGNLEAIRNYTDARDIVKAYTMAIFLESGIYNLCSDVTISIQEVLNNYIKLAHHPIETIENKFLYRPSSLKFPKPNCEKFKALTNWSPKINLEKTLIDTLNHWREIV